MRRSFRVYLKKRGNRRTGSRALGRLGELVFFGLFLVAGCVGIALIVTTEIIPQWRVNHEFAETACVVRAKQIGHSHGEDGDVYRPEIQIEYEIAGKKYVTKTYDIAVAGDSNGSYSGGRAEKEKILEHFDVGREYACWYDPLDPNVCVLVRGYSLIAWLLLAVPAAFVLVGGGGFVYRMLHWGKSAERYAAGSLAGDLFERGAHGPDDFPNVPPGADMTNSPGTRLKYRLPISTSATWALVSIGVFCLIWNGIVLGVGFFVCRGFWGPGAVEWIPLVILIPFALAGVLLIGLFFRQLLLTTGVGQTYVEISDHPLFPGERYELLVSQAGRLRMNSLEVFLVCEEAATYRQGTDTRTETHCVFRKELFRREDFEIHHGLPFQQRCEMEIPLGMTHSFKSPNNEVNWKIIVAGDVDRWPDYQRSFPVIVFPGRSDNGRGLILEDDHE